MKIYSHEVITIGRDEHRKRKNNYLSQTPKKQKSDGRDIEFSEEFAGHDEQKTQARNPAGGKRAKKK